MVTFLSKTFGFVVYSDCSDFGKRIDVQKEFDKFIEEEKIDITD